MEFTNYPANLIEAALPNKEDLASIDLNKLSDWLSHLSERERDLIKMRYEDGRTLSAIGEEYGVTKARVHQMEKRALRKLRHPVSLKSFRSKMYDEHEATLKKLQNENAELRHQYVQLRSYTNSLHEAIAKELPSLTRIIRLLPTAYDAENSVSNVLIRDMGLSVRSTHSLLRSGYATAFDIEKLTFDEISQIKNLGERSINETRDRLKELGFSPKF